MSGEEGAFEWYVHRLWWQQHPTGPLVTQAMMDAWVDTYVIDVGL